jgi:hypothetical protein
MLLQIDTLFVQLKCSGMEFMNQYFAILPWVIRFYCLIFWPVFFFIHFLFLNEKIKVELGNLKVPEIAVGVKA